MRANTGLRTLSIQMGRRYSGKVHLTLSQGMVTKDKPWQDADQRAWVSSLTLSPSKSTHATSFLTSTKMAFSFLASNMTNSCSLIFTLLASFVAFFYVNFLMQHGNLQAQSDTLDTFQHGCHCWFGHFPLRGTSYVHYSYVCSTHGLAESHQLTTCLVFQLQGHC